MRAHSSGFDVLGRSSFSANSSPTARNRCSSVMPSPAPEMTALIACFFARSTMLAIIAPELKSRKYSISLDPSA